MLAPLVLAPNCPEELVQQVWKAHAQNALSTAASKPPISVNYSLVQGLVESTRHVSEYRQSGYLNATRVANGQIQCAVTTLESDWRTVQQ